MNEKGFTLVELLAILVILAIIVLVSVAGIVNMNKDLEDNSDLYDTIYMAAETYVYHNYSNYRELDEVGSTSLVSVIELINNDYLKGSVINPKDDEKFTSDDYIEVKRNEDMTLSFDIVEKFPPLIKLNRRDNYTNGTDEFLTVIFDKNGGTVECYNQLGLLNNLTFNSLALGQNEISCVATATNGTTTSFTETIVLNGYFDYNHLYANAGGYKSDDAIILPSNGVQFGPYYKMLKGCYMVEITGTNLSVEDGIAAYENINNVNYPVSLLSKIGTSDNIIYYINPEENKTTRGIEFYYRNSRDTDVTINNIKVTLIDSCPVE